MARIFKTPFGAQGDTEQVPEAPQGDGSVSLTQGFGYDYEREYEDPAAKDIRREVMNGLFHDVTEAIGDIQLSGIAKWSEDAAPYPAGAVVWHNNAAWLARVGNNSVEPVAGDNWFNLGAAVEEIDEIAQNAPWISRAIGEEIWLDDSNPAVDVPPTDNPNFRYIKLTAGENGSGDYNEGVLINENVSGSAPLIEATAEVNLLSSSFHGQTVRLLNTERRFVRAGSPGELQNDQMQQITGKLDSPLFLGNYTSEGAFTYTTISGSQLDRGQNGETAIIEFNSADSPDARTSETTDGETRPRNIGRTVYMRIL